MVRLFKHRQETPLTRNSVRMRHHIRVRRRFDHHRRIFLKRTVSAQIHAWAALASLGSVLLLAFLSYSHGWRHIMSSVIFGLSAVLLFSASAMLHFFTDGYRVSKKFEKILENIDKFCIHILIAGTYTAVIGISLVDPLRTRMLTTIWVFAFFGIIYTIFYDYFPKPLRSRALYTSQFLVMGWLVLFCINEVMSSLSASQVLWVFSGGILYSIGAIIYAIERPNPTKHFGYHEIWHVLVVLGCLSFFMVVFLNYT